MGIKMVLQVGHRALTDASQQPGQGAPGHGEACTVPLAEPVPESIWSAAVTFRV